MHYYSVSGKYCFKAGSLKTNHANRVIPLSKEALTLLKNIKRNEYFNSINSGIEIDGYKNFVFLNSRKNNVIIPRACLKFDSSHLHAPLCGIFGSNSGYIARYAPFILPKAPTNCDIHLAESNFQTRSGVCFYVWIACEGFYPLLCAVFTLKCGNMAGLQGKYVCAKMYT